MNQKQTLKLIRELGLSASVTSGTYKVTARNGSYLTNDAQDALDTARLMATEQQNQAKRIKNAYEKLVPVQKKKNICDEIRKVKEKVTPSRKIKVDFEFDDQFEEDEHFQEYYGDDDF